MTSATTDWKARHPFPIGRKVYCKAGRYVPGLRAGVAYTVQMRGESPRGLWVALADVTPYEFPVEDLTDVSPMPAVLEDVEAE